MSEGSNTDSNTGKSGATKPITLRRVVSALRRTPAIMRAEQREIVKTYRGRKTQAHEAFKRDAQRLAADGFTATPEVWEDGAWGAGGFTAGFLLMLVSLFVFFPVAIFILLYMLIVKPKGTLTVTYRR